MYTPFEGERDAVEDLSDAKARLEALFKNRFGFDYGLFWGWRERYELANEGTLFCASNHDSQDKELLGGSGI